MSTQWFTERLHPNVHQAIRIKRALYRGRSAFQRILVYDTYEYGRMLVLDGVVQTTEADEHVYHEMLTHMPLMTHERPRNVLIIGGGDGGILREVLKYPVKKVTLVEIDGEVIALSKKWLRSICIDAFKDKRVNVIVDDGAKFVQTSPGTFDAIIIDSPDPIGPGTVLFARRFYQGCAQRLMPEGVLARQTGALALQADELPDAVARLRGTFQYVQPYVACVPTYIGGLFSFVLAGRGEMVIPPQNVLEKRLRSLEFSTRYYSPAMHHAACVLPRDIHGAVARELADAETVRR